MIDEESRSGWEKRAQRDLSQIDASRAAFEHEQLIAYRKLLYVIVDRLGLVRLHQSALDNLTGTETVTTWAHPETGEVIVTAVKR